MNYSINIVYTGNQNKAGKLTLIDTNSGEVLLNKVPVAIPTQIIKQGPVELGVSLKIKNTSKKSEYALDSEYSKVIDKFILMDLPSIVSIDDVLNFIGNIPLGNNRTSLNATDDSFVLYKDDYNKIKSIANGKSFSFTGETNQFELTTKKVIFLWLPEKVNTDKNETNITKAFKELTTKEESARKRLNIEFSDPLREKNNDTFKVVKQAVKAVEITKTVLSNEKENTEQDARRLKEQINREKLLVDQREYDRREQDRRYYENSNSGNLDALDIVLMYNNPELAPIFKPNSMLAWALYFNHDKKEVTNSSVQENIKNVPGFETVEHSEVKYSPMGYSVSMYEDEQKQKLIGTLVHDSSSNSYVMQSPDGNKTQLSIDDNGDAKGSVFGEKGNTSFDLVQSPTGGYTGNWESESSEGIKISSGVSMSESFSSTSAPFEPVNIASVVESRDSYKEAMKYEPETAPKWEIPPPPPPPPPTDDVRWGSTSDSYSNSASFSP